MDSAETSNEQQGIQLRVAFMLWAGCLGALALLIVLASSLSLNIFGLIILFYLGVGFYLNRSVLRRLIEWHPMYNTLDNVTSEKLKFFFLWPITYFFLFIRLGINKVL